MSDLAWFRFLGRPAKGLAAILGLAGLLGGLDLSLAQPVPSTDLSLCQPRQVLECQASDCQKPDTQPPFSLYVHPAMAQAWLKLSAQPDDHPPLSEAKPEGMTTETVDEACFDAPVVRLPVEAAQVQWVTLLHNDVARPMRGGLMIQYDTAGGHPDWVKSIEAIDPTDPADTPSSVNALPQPTGGHKSTRWPSRRAKATWVWAAQTWVEQPVELAADLAGQGIDRVYIDVPLVNDNQALGYPKTLKAFLAEAYRQGIHVWVVEGSPYGLTVSGQKTVLQRARTYQAFNATLPQAHRLKGIQYHIEPYLMPGYYANPALWNQAYVALMNQVKTETGFALDSVLPFWFDQARVPRLMPGVMSGVMPRLMPDASGSFLDALAPYVDTVTVMDYRTRPEAIESFAQPFLAWGQQSGKPVVVALETGPLPDESFEAYRPLGWSTHRRARLWLLPYDTDHKLLVLLKQGANLGSAGEAFRFSHHVTVPASRVTYHDQFARFQGDLTDVSRRLQRWPAFGGMAIHFWGSYKALLVGDKMPVEPETSPTP